MPNPLFEEPLKSIPIFFGEYGGCADSKGYQANNIFCVIGVVEFSAFFLDNNTYIPKN